MYQKGIISLTGFAEGMSINNELAKNSNLLLASRFFGTLAAESFTVRRRCNRFTSSFCDNQQKRVLTKKTARIERQFLFFFFHSEVLQFLDLWAILSWKIDALHFLPLLKCSMYPVAPWSIYNGGKKFNLKQGKSNRN